MNSANNSDFGLVSCRSWNMQHVTTSCSEELDVKPEDPASHPPIKMKWEDEMHSFLI